MKRSEMLELVLRKLKEGGYDSVSLCLIEDTLNFAEEAGMLPPTTKLKSINATDNAWEPEND